MIPRSLISDGDRQPASPTAGRSGSLLPRRRLLALALLAPAGIAALSACSGSSTGSDGPDPLIALADQAHRDTELAAAAITATPSLSTRLEPLRAARAEHAAALEAEITRLDPSRAGPAAAAQATGNTTQRPTLTAVRDALTTSTRGAQALVATLPAERVGLVASVAACCATYVAVLG
ncbi:hypothetical protein [Pseudonocardia acidicola]|uniref:DUF4439 domain-containing protein n=1 Tax=Pseudonocardia acidicola TaxID=2724939 RepID=A0ABX1S5K2_9PSEU|nr:hypothetical protein [Pseudonocardia acidicola]NMH96067.1 hypothetical protein [Pseudonocardia acidicola]